MTTKGFNAYKAFKLTSTAVATPEQAKHFLTQCSVWHAEAEIPEGNRILLSLYCLTGKAGKWATPYIKAINEHKIAVTRSKVSPPELPFSSWETFEEVFLAFFAKGNTMLTAFNDLEHLTTQTGWHMMVGNYTQKFDELAKRSGLSDWDLTMRYRQGLPFAIQENLVIIPSMKQLLQEVQVAAISINQNLPVRRKGQRNPPNPPSSSSSKLSLQKKDNPTTTCWLCRQKGHKAPQCPNKGKPRVAATEQSTSEPKEDSWIASLESTMDKVLATLQNIIKGKTNSEDF